ncbi:MAG: large conductance mechanosensitive channel protein MscL [Candidatus Micrarchaeaceae archaeon]
MPILEEFKNFITKGNVIDLAVAVVVGTAFNAVITAFVTDIITPLIGVAGHVDFSGITYTINNSTFLLGTFLNAIISFFTIVIVIFLLLVKPATKIKERQLKNKPVTPPDTKACPECLSQIPIKAKRCAFCTSKLS